MSPVNDDKRPQATGAIDHECTIAAPATDAAAGRGMEQPLVTSGFLDHYQILEPLGQGTTGTVFSARDTRLDRLVAIKVLAPELADNPTARQRFLREARAAAAIDDRNVVGCFAVQEMPIPYIVLEYVKGETLKQKLDREGALSLQEVLTISEQVARGLAAAHSLGLIHRDIKPANILLEDLSASSSDLPRIQAKLADFGLARAVEDDGLTQSGAISGTPLYMAPEQAQSQSVDHRADLFSLGSVLYEMCTGRPPFQAPNAMAVLKEVCEQSPPNIWKINPSVPRWFCDLVEKLQAKDPANRYQTARQVAEILGRYAKRPPSRVRRSYWAVRSSLRKRKGTIAAVAGLVLFLIAAFFAPRFSAQSPGEPDGPAAISLEPDDNLKLPSAEELAARPAAADTLGRERISPDALTTAGRGNPTNAPKEIVAILGGPVFKHRGGDVGTLAWSPNGKFIATAAGTYDSAQKIFTDWEVKLWHPDTAQVIREFRGHAAVVHALAFSPDSRRLVTGSGDHTAKVWDVESGAEFFTLRGHKSRIRTVAWSPDGKWIATGADLPDNSVVLWNAENGNRVSVFRNHQSGVMDVAFSPDGTLAASVSTNGDESMRVWEVSGGKEIARFTDIGSNPRAAVFLANGKWVAGSSDESVVRIWDIASGQTVLELGGHTGWVTCLVRSPDGSYMASGSTDNTIRIWDSKGAFLRTITHPDWVLGLAFSPDSKRVVSSSRDGRIHIWDVETGHELLPFGHDRQVVAVAVSPDGKHLASSALGDDRRIRIWDLSTGQVIRKLSPVGHTQYTLVFSPDGQTLASGSTESGAIALWNWKRGNVQETLTSADNKVSQLAISPDGRFLAYSVAFGETRLYDLASCQWRTIGGGTSDLAGCLAFRPDGKFLATSGADKMLHLWRVDDGTKRADLRGTADTIRWAGFSPDGRSIAFCEGTGDPTIRYWGLTPVLEKPSLQGHLTGAMSCAWRPDGHVLASAGATDGTIRLWDVARGGARVLTIPLFPNETKYLQSIAWTPEGRHLIVGNPDGTIYVLRLAKQGEVFQVP